MPPKIILIDESDNITGYSEKLEAHQEGKLHRAFSAFILNSKNELLIQQRAFQKYHSGGLWSNTCCGHFINEKDTEEQAEKRLFEEMSIKTRLKRVFNYRYSALMDNGLIENEFVYSYLGFSEDDPVNDPNEVNDWKWIELKILKKTLIQYPEIFTYWFRYSFDDFLKSLYD